MPIAALNGININYKVDGEGEPLVMIMGFGSPLKTGMNQVPFFKKHYRVITFDNRGVGKSDKPQGPYSTKMMADDTAKLMDYLSIEKAHILGVSMGGMIAQELAINHPQKIQKLILACTYAGGQDVVNQNDEELAQALQQNQNMPAIMIDRSFNKPLYKFFFGLFAKMPMRSFGAEEMAGFAGQSAACAKHDTLERLQLIKAPTLVIAGSKDRLINPGSSKVIASKIPNAKLVKIEGGSHSFFIEMKKEFNREVFNFLKTPRL